MICKKITCHLIFYLFSAFTSHSLPPLHSYSNNARRTSCSVTSSLIDIGLNVCIQNGLLCKFPFYNRLPLATFISLSLEAKHEHSQPIVELFPPSSRFDNGNLLLSINCRFCLDKIVSLECLGRHYSFALETVFVSNFER
jgi:hypothetical protein